ncbi:MAG: hypothetical protein Q7S85_11715 [Rugosibacter sp.]|nr:hypothetical protein [Rugosibacter sp.]
MEAFLLTLDVISLILLCRGVLRVSRSGDDKDLGWFAYSVTRVKKEKRSFADQEVPRA